MTKALPTLFLLCCSNIFMTAAWYGQLRFPQAKLWVAILVSWAIALFEYCLAVPANRIGYANGLSTAQLKIMQECITLVVFTVVAFALFRETPRWNMLVSYALIVAAVFFAFKF